MVPPTYALSADELSKPFSLLVSGFRVIPREKLPIFLSHDERPFGFVETERGVLFGIKKLYPGGGEWTSVHIVPSPFEASSWGIPASLSYRREPWSYTYELSFDDDAAVVASFTTEWSPRCSFSGPRAFLCGAVVSGLPSLPLRFARHFARREGGLLLPETSRVESERGRRRL